MSYDPSTVPDLQVPSTPYWDGFLTSLSGRFTDGVAQLNNELSGKLSELTEDPSNPQLLAEYQAKLSEYTLFRNAQSNVVKVYKDVGAAIITNFR
ncbi:type III secretion system needle filament subunit SctF [Yersinia kristensenii]|uniref:type III secretion system needle filament subunit SctF n=1 Tax=Yersinia kristensenii TaxID=28152 RepID=UPI0005E955FF|nr:type III secretion system needle filament subunit SctF [Yersinia kristensenii]CNF34351.1 type III secretion system needle complex protein PrgI [Yersinia kristensenii]